MYIDPAESTVRCLRKGFSRVLLGCLNCPLFPCAAIGEEQLARLRASLFTMPDPEAPPWAQKKVRMHIFRMNDGSLREAPEGFRPESPDEDMLRDVAEVLCVGKILVKQLRLVPRPAEERAAIRSEQERLMTIEEAAAEDGLLPQVSSAEKAPDRPRNPRNAKKS
ncbi:MAG: hypothetical protein J5855_02940 [Mailhella sp.]|nr:hypothetical protein [Mailhella sp.]